MKIKIIVENDNSRKGPTWTECELVTAGDAGKLSAAQLQLGLAHITEQYMQVLFEHAIKLGKTESPEFELISINELGPDVMQNSSPAPQLPSDEQLYECTECGWELTEKEKVDKHITPKGLSYGEYRCCPNCNNHEFFIIKNK